MKNKYLYNAGSELNEKTGYYETLLRNYDPALGRFAGVDVLAGLTPGMTPYHFGRNNPVMYNDPTGAYSQGWQDVSRFLSSGAGGGNPFGEHFGPGSRNHWTDWIDGGTGNGIFSPGFSGSGWTLTAGNLSINYGELPDGIHNFSFSGGQVSGYSYQTDIDSQPMGLNEAATYFDTGIKTHPVVTSRGYANLENTKFFGKRFAQSGGIGDGLAGIYTIYESLTPEIYANIEAALAAHPEWSTLTYNGGGKAARRNRYQALKNIAICTPGQSRDEFPYASTIEGGAGAWVICVPVEEQSIQGMELRALYTGMEAGDQFKVVLIPKYPDPQPEPVWQTSPVALPIIEIIESLIFTF